MPIDQSRVSKMMLRNVHIFSALPESQLNLLAAATQRKSYPRGATILRGGESTVSLYVLVAGSVQVVFTDRHGAEVILGILAPGDYFGEMGLIDDLPRSATVTARESCEILILSKKDFTTCLKANFKLAMAVHRGLVKRLRGANSKISSLALLDVHGRVAKLLLEMAENVDGNSVVRNLSRQEIAKFIGASREMVSRILSNLQLQGHIEITRSSIILKSRPQAIMRSRR